LTHVKSPDRATGYLECMTNNRRSYRETGWSFGVKTSEAEWASIETAVQPGK
jgi:hypothetical protein